MESQSKSSWMSSAGMRRMGKFPVGIMCCWFICAWWPKEYTHHHEPRHIQHATDFIPYIGLNQHNTFIIHALIIVERIVLKLNDWRGEGKPLTCQGVSCVVHWGHMGITWRTHHRGHALSWVHVHISWKIITDIHPLTKRTNKNILQ